MAGAQDDFAEFYKANYGRVVALVGAMLGDRHQAEDIAQEAFARAPVRWPKIARYDLPEAWVRRVSLRLTIDASRRRRRASLAVALLAGRRREGKPDPLASTALTLALMRLPLLSYAKTLIRLSGPLRGRPVVDVIPFRTPLTQGVTHILVLRSRRVLSHPNPASPNGAGPDDEDSLSEVVTAAESRAPRPPREVRILARTRADLGDIGHLSSLFLSVLSGYARRESALS